MVVFSESHTIKNSKQSERAQRKFIRFTRYTLKVSCHPHCYAAVSNIRVLPSLAERRHAVGIKFVEELLNGKIEFNLHWFRSFVLRYFSAVPKQLFLITTFKLPQVFSK